VSNLSDTIACAKFQDETFRGYDFTGSRIYYFPIDFCMGLTTVLPVIIVQLTMNVFVCSDYNYPRAYNDDAIYYYT